MSSHFTACAKLFVLFLYENKHLGEDFSIPIDEAEEIFKNNFKKQYKTFANFYLVFHYVSSYCIKGNNNQRHLLIFNETKLRNLCGRKAQLETVFAKLPSKITKKTVVTQSIAFSDKLKSGNKNGLPSAVSKKECKSCNIRFPNTESFNIHLSGRRHQFLHRVTEALKQSNKKSKSQNDIVLTVAESTSLSNIIVRKNVSKVVKLRVKNASKQLHKIVKIEKDEVNEVNFNPVLPVSLPSSASVEFNLTVCSNIAVFYLPILMTVEMDDITSEIPFELVFHCHDPILDDLQPTEPYKRQTKPAISDIYEEIDEGEPPKFSSSKSLQKVKLQNYPLTRDYAFIFNTGLKPTAELAKSQQKLLTFLTNLFNVADKTNCLTRQNYADMLHTFLYLEEHQMNSDIRYYDREDQELKPVRGSNLLDLEVPGLAEHRPSVIVGDVISVKESKTAKVIYRGYVHRVSESTVSLNFSQRFTNKVYVKGKKFCVSFSFNRFPLKVEHQAVDLVRQHKISSVFFPKTAPKVAPADISIAWINPNISNNPEQQQAVKSILQNTSVAFPYIIFGPPGTGKTMTVVEAVKQVYKRTRLNVLICTPSNSAANELAKRLIESVVPPSDLFRYLAMSFPLSQVPDGLKKSINYRNGDFYHPSIEELMKFRILITTLCTASKLVNYGCPNRHFGYVFIDESGQATETETLIAISGILSSMSTLSGQIVLAGDPKQLGPIIHSTVAKEYGFDTSMLERLMNTIEPYKKNDSKGYDANMITKLLKNYRSHPAIFKTSNELFYDNELECAGDKNVINIATAWSELPNSKFPLIFHSIVGVDQREKNSPSFFNVAEIGVVLSYLDKLIGSRLRGMQIKEEHIGIISPYKKQVEKIKQACQKKKYDNSRLMVGTVEQIQGQERLIIILSTVRSRTKFIGYDNKFHLGFLRNPKRLNVALTRAKALLIVIGNPNVLQLDEYWRSFIKYCCDNDALLGEKFEFVELSQQTEDILNMEDLSLQDLNNSLDGPSFARGNN